MSIPHRAVGSGTRTVIVTHGWFGSSQGWGQFPDYLDGEAFTYVFTILLERHGIVNRTLHASGLTSESLSLLYNTRAVVVAMVTVLRLSGEKAHPPPSASSVRRQREGLLGEGHSPQRSALR